MGDRSLKSASCSQGAPRNQNGVNSVKSAVYQKSRQSAMDRCETAALKRRGVADGPVGQHAAAAAAGDAELVGVHPAARDQFVDARHQIFEIVARDRRTE